MISKCFRLLKGPLGMVGLGVIGVVGLVILAKQIYQYNEEESRLMTQRFKMESLVESLDSWESRAEWIQRKIPRFDTQKGASTYLLESLESSLAKHGLKLDSYEFHPRKIDKVISAETLQQFDRATVDVKIKGREQGIVQWIHELQAPGNFTGIDHLTMELGHFGLLCELEVSQWYLGNNRSLGASQHQEAKVHDLGPSLVDRF